VTPYILNISDVSQLLSWTGIHFFSSCLRRLGYNTFCGVPGDTSDKPLACIKADHWNLAIDQLVAEILKAKR